jgi:hypothetical protein
LRELFVLPEPAYFVKGKFCLHPNIQIEMILGEHLTYSSWKARKKGYIPFK